MIEKNQKLQELKIKRNEILELEKQKIIKLLKLKKIKSINEGVLKITKIRHLKELEELKTNYKVKKGGLGRINGISEGNNKNKEIENEKLYLEEILELKKIQINECNFITNELCKFKDLILINQEKSKELKERIKHSLTEFSKELESEKQNILDTIKEKNRIEKEKIEKELEAFKELKQKEIQKIQREAQGIIGNLINNNTNLINKNTNVKKIANSVDEQKQILENSMIELEQLQSSFESEYERQMKILAVKLQKKKERHWKDQRLALYFGNGKAKTLNDISTNVVLGNKVKRMFLKVLQNAKKKKKRKLLLRKKRILQKRKNNFQLVHDMKSKLTKLNSLFKQIQEEQKSTNNKKSNTKSQKNDRTGKKSTIKTRTQKGNRTGKKETRNTRKRIRR